MNTLEQKQTYRQIKLPYMNPEVVSKEIGDFVVDSVVSGKQTGCVIGLSGGIDSTTTAILIKVAFDNYNLKNKNQNKFNPIELVGYILPSYVNNLKDTEDGIRVAEKLGIRYEKIILDKIVDAFTQTVPDAMNVNYNKGNAISRIRGNVLSTKASLERKILAGTGNKDEDFGVGYYTLFGDGAVHMSPIGGLSKRLVREMATYLNVEKDLVNRIPTAGLEKGQTDFKDLGYEYDVVELVSEGIVQDFSRDALIKHPQIVPLVTSQIKKHTELYGKSILTNVEAVVDDIFARNKTAMYKAEIIHPPSPKITLEYRPAIVFDELC